MPTLAIAPPGRGVSIGRLEAVGGTGNDVLYGRPVLVRQDETGTRSFEQNGAVRVGKPLDVKPDVHWVLEPVEGGGFQLWPVLSWYEFGKLSRADRQVQIQVGAGDDAAADTHAKRRLELAEEELRRESGLRKEHAERWETMLEKRGGNTGSRMMRGQMIIEASKQDTVKVSYPEEERLNDDTGLKRHKRKMMKALKRKADAIEKEDVPDTANSLHQLKSEQSEAIWDFSDGEKFSDDEQDKWDFDEQLQNDDVDEQAAQLPEAGDEVSEAEEGDLLSAHGKELEVLLERHTGSTNDDEVQADGDACAVSSDSDDSEEEVSAKQRSKQKDKDDASVPKRSQVKPAGKDQGKRKMILSGVSRSASSTAAPAVEPPAAVSITLTPSESGDHVLSNSELRKRTIECLRQRGGTCKLSNVVAALGLRSQHSPLYKRAVAVLKEVADVQRMPGESRPLLVLKREHWSVADGRPI